MKLVGKSIVITGGTAGIGYELVRQLQADNEVLVIAGNAERLARIREKFAGVRTRRADLAAPDEAVSAAEHVRQCLPRIDVLVNNAAVQYEPTLLDPDFDIGTIQREIAVNFTAACTLTAALLPSLLHGGEAAVVNINSGLGLSPKTNSAVYCATKAALNAFSQSLRYQLEGSTVRVMQAFLPLVDTGMTRGRGNGKLSPGRAAQAILEGVEAGIDDNDIGKVRLLRTLVRLSPGLARRIMKAA